jgi:hypothetical protein
MKPACVKGECPACMNLEPLDKLFSDFGAPKPPDTKVPEVKFYQVQKCEG